MELLSLEALGHVSGGQNSTEVSTPLGTYKSNETNYGRCHTTAQTYCDTRPKNRTSFLGFDTGVNTAKSADCMRTTLPAMCGKPGSK